MITVTASQREFVASAAPFPCFVGGYGAGKTYALVLRLLNRLVDGVTLAYYMPNYGLIREVAMPRVAAMLETLFGIRPKMNLQLFEMTVPRYGRIIFRSMDAPESIIGFEVSDSFLDELDTLPTHKARQVWELALSRNRQKRSDKRANTMAVATTPEGFCFVYEQWGRDQAKAEAAGYRLYRGRSADNPSLPPDYIENLRRTYPENRLSAYLDGQFVNMTSGSVYPDFNRVDAHIPAVLEAGEALHIGMDFNVMNMTAIVSVIRGNDPVTVAEITGVRDTPAMCATLRDRYAGRSITIYPDASGASRKSVNAQESDIMLLKQAGFTIRTNPSNPAIKDRVLSVNAMLPRWKINTDNCPRLVEALEQQAYDRNGEPDKTTGHDHAIDAAGYFIAHRWPIVKRSASVSTLRF